MTIAPATGLRIEQYAAGRYSLRRTARELGLTVGQVTGYADRNGVKFSADQYGVKSCAMFNKGGKPKHARRTSKPNQSLKLVTDIAMMNPNDHSGALRDLIIAARKIID